VLPAERSGLPNPTEARNFPSCQNIQTGFEVHPAFYSMGIGVISWG